MLDDGFVGPGLNEEAGSDLIGGARGEVGLAVEDAPFCALVVIWNEIGTLLLPVPVGEADVAGWALTARAGTGYVNLLGPG